MRRDALSAGRLLRRKYSEQRARHCSCTLGSMQMKSHSLIAVGLTMLAACGGNIDSGESANAESADQNPDAAVDAFVAPPQDAGSPARPHDAGSGHQCGPNEFWDGGCLPCFAADAGAGSCAEAEVIEGVCYEYMCSPGWCACIVDDVVQSQNNGEPSNVCADPTQVWTSQCGFPSARDAGAPPVDAGSGACGPNEFWDGGCLPCFAADGGAGACSQAQVINGVCYAYDCSPGWCACIVDDVVQSQTQEPANICADTTLWTSVCGFPSTDGG
jgi:hypothetical protein